MLCCGMGGVEGRGLGSCGYRSPVSKNDWKRPPAARVVRIRDRLRELYGIPRMAPHGRPLDELILTGLSQSTNDRNRDVAFLRLRERFADAPGGGVSWRGGGGGAVGG